MGLVRRFELHRDHDVSGVSGPGVVADGAQFAEDEVLTWPDGKQTALPAGWCRVTWRGRYRSIVLWPSIDQVIAVNGHGGATRIVWLDDEPAGGELPSGLTTAVNTGRSEPVLTAEQWRARL